MECEHSPTSFNPTATFAGVIHIAKLEQPIELVLSGIRCRGTVSTNPACTDRYVLQALRRIGDAFFGSSSFLSRERELYEAIKARIPLLNQIPSTNSSFPIVSLSPDGVRVGKARSR